MKEGKKERRKRGKDDKKRERRTVKKGKHDGGKIQGVKSMICTDWPLR